MTDDTLSARVDALERALTDGRDLPDLSETSRVAARLTEVEDRVDELDDRVDELDAAVQALRGYVGEVRHVNRAVERRADAALAAVESLDDADRSPDLASDGGAASAAPPSAVSPAVASPSAESTTEPNAAGSSAEDATDGDEVDGALARLRNAL
ncbi:hypothetical protein ACFQPA_08980 [Halomarina halobia]|uniref:DUF7310 domain-containing protein n=1 Tax=Halomarina halobia TaxID=3033386 RepID=A0ABD6AC63_9EURY|nr:hypothetical protein [Halomarina sp. PSR21]